MSTIQSPIIFREGDFTQEDLDKFKTENKIWRLIDIYRQQLSELYEIKHPHFDPIKDESDRAAFIDRDKNEVLAGCWVYFPWSGIFMHCLAEDELFLLRTNRNKNLITEDEQSQLYQSCVGVCGLSVGNSIALTMAYSGLSRSMKLTDFDVLETANLNRLRAGLHHVGKMKAEIAAQQIWELNPFARLELYKDGLDDDNLDKFFRDPKLHLVFDEIDDFPMKIKLRMKAREVGVPVIMLTSLGDNVLIDIERYDLDSATEIFNGLVGDTPEEILTKNIGEREKVQYAIDLVGAENIPTRALESLFEINKSLVGRPQLASTITIDGGLGAYLVRRILLGHDVPSGRYYMSLDKMTNLAIEDESDRRNVAINKLNDMLGR